MTPAGGPAADQVGSGPQRRAAAGQCGTVRVLGLDPGSRSTGFGVIEAFPGGARYLASGSIRAAGEDLASRLREIYAGVAAIMAEHRPGEVAIERVFVHRNPDSALKLGQARGAALCATFGAAGALFDYSPREVKLAVVGHGNAAKQQVQRMVKVLLGIEGRLGVDAADALAIALCHAHGRATYLAAAAGGAGRAR
jgi:crossover junction endodeoxyribonuclease RuvC